MKNISYFKCYIFINFFKTCCNCFFGRSFRC